MFISEGRSGFGQYMRSATPAREARSGTHYTVAARRFF
jgi:hypothetical protein